MSDHRPQPADIRAEFHRRFGGDPLLVRSPGRVNLIGEHTDYNSGWVLPGAVDRSVIFAVGRRPDRRLHAVALDATQEFICDLDGLKNADPSWPNYLMGVVDQLQQAGRSPGGFNCVFGGDVPIGAGLSSSAALECGLIFALNELYGLELTPLRMVQLAQRAENQFVGVQCGIMDQYVNMFGRAGQVIKLDCRTLEHEYAPFGRSDLVLAICDTGVRRRLAASEYNVRRSQCESGVQAVRRGRPEVASLRDVTLPMLEAIRGEMEPVVFRRCAYVINENRRVEEACLKLADGDLAALGRLMAASHAGLRDEYEVSCAELDALVEAAAAVEGVLGARMMGAGFGGCTINLLREGCLDRFREALEADYERRYGRRPPIHVVRISEGTRLIPG